MTHQTGYQAMPLAHNIVGIVLAGGKSTRMGQNKANLLWKKTTLLENVVENLNLFGCKFVRISGAQDIVDTIENIGPLGGISSCLNTLNFNDWILFWPVDVLITKEALKAFEQKVPPEVQAVYYKNNPLPLLLKNTQNIRENLNIYLNNQKYAVKSWLKGLNCYELAEKEFQNLNTPEEYKKAVNL